MFGWVSYTLSRSERYRSEQYTDRTAKPDAHGLAPYDFDRTHLFNVVAGMPLRRNWDIGVRWQYQSGAPVPVTSGYNAAREATATCASTCASTSARSSEVAARFLRRHHQRRAACRKRFSRAR